MNFAFAAILFLLFYLPGALVIQQFARKDVPFTLGTFSGRTVLALLAAITLHFIWLPAIHYAFRWLGLQFDTSEEQFVVLFAAGQTSDIYTANVVRLSQNLLPTAIYFVSIFGFATVIGLSARYIVRRFGLDVSYRFLRLYPEWEYILSGDFYFYNTHGEVRDKRRDIISIFAEIAVELGGNVVVYAGVIEEYWFAENNADLDALPLSNTRKFKLPKNGEALDQQDLGGQEFIIKYSEIKNLTLRYLVTRIEP